MYHFFFNLNFIMTSKIPVVFFIASLFLLPATAQSNLENLLEISMSNYPVIKAAQLRSMAARQDVITEYRDLIPRLSASYQVNYATANNISGMLYPGSILPISGPVTSENNNQMFTGSAAGLLMTWNPYTFGKRSSRIDRAESEAEAFRLHEELTLLDFKTRFIETYLNYIGFLSLEETQQSELDRLEFNLALARELAVNGLRPGVDSSQIKTEFAQAKIELLAIQRNIQFAKEQLYEYLAGNEQQLPEAGDTFLNDNLTHSTDFQSGIHPRLNLAVQKRLSLEAGQKILRRSLYPDLTLWGTGFARGSAVAMGNDVQNAEGFNFSKHNYGIGFQISLPLLDFSRTSSQLKKQNMLVSALKEEEEHVRLQLNKERNLALVTYRNAIEAAKHAEAFVEFSDYSFQAVNARYEAGLVNLTELLHAQFQLKKAQSDEVKIRLELWKSLLYLAAVEGDMEIFLEQIR
jgi:outer membrane protein